MQGQLCNACLEMEQHLSDNPPVPRRLPLLVFVFGELKDDFHQINQLEVLQVAS